MTCDTALEEQVVRVLQSDRPHAYCDGCLALRVGATLEDARRAAARVATDVLAFDRTRSACHGCGRILEITRLR
jgi:hypothetical protein